MENKCTKLELLEIIKFQEDLISQQAKTIVKITNENIEKDSIINELMNLN